MSIRTWPGLAVVLAILWLFIRGVPPTGIGITREFVLGLLIGAPLAYGVRRLYEPQFKLGRALRALPYAVLYFLAFLRELLTANVDVARRVLSPWLPLEPDVIVIQLRVETDLAITTIANSITLTPGTLTMDHDADTNTLYIHAIDASDRDAVVDPIRTWEDYALVIFDESGKPGDPPPQQDGTTTADASESGGDADGN